MPDLIWMPLPAFQPVHSSKTVGFSWILIFQFFTPLFLLSPPDPKVWWNATEPHPRQELKIRTRNTRARASTSLHLIIDIT